MLDELVGRSALEREEFVADDGGEPAVGTRAASVLARHGVRPGDRVSLLVAPSVELLIATFAVWKAGGVPVVADASAGLVRLRRLVRGAPPPFIIGTPATLAAGRLTRFSPGARLAAFASLAGVADLRQSRAAATFTPVTPHADDVAAIVHTSGATGPAKPVRYTHAALAAQRHALAELWTIRAAESFTTSFGPFMLLAPALGMGFIRPDFDVNRPGELDFDVLASAVGRGDVTTAWLSRLGSRGRGDGRRATAPPASRHAGRSPDPEVARQPDPGDHRR